MISFISGVDRYTLSYLLHEIVITLDFANKTIFREIASR